MKTIKLIYKGDLPSFELAGFGLITRSKAVKVPEKIANILLKRDGWEKLSKAKEKEVEK